MVDFSRGSSCFLFTCESTIKKYDKIKLRIFSILEIFVYFYNVHSFKTLKKVLRKPPRINKQKGQYFETKISMHTIQQNHISNSGLF